MRHEITDLTDWTRGDMDINTAPSFDVDDYADHLTGAHQRSAPVGVVGPGERRHEDHSRCVHRRDPGQRPPLPAVPFPVVAA